MPHIALIGASGFIGRHLAAQLSAQGNQLRLVSRKPAACLPALAVLPGVQLTPVDTHDQQALTALFAGCDAVISMAGILHGTPAQFAAVHAALPARIVRACRASGVRRLIHISALGAASDAASHYQQSKAAGEQVVTRSELDWTILRPSVVFGRDDQFLNLFAALQRWLPVLPLAGAQAQFEPVWVEDVARAVTRALTLPNSIASTLDLVGPQRYTLAQLVRYSGLRSGHPRPIIPLPHALGLLQAGLLECLPGPPLMSRDNLRSLARDNISQTGFPSALLGFAPQALEAVLPL